MAATIETLEVTCPRCGRVSKVGPDQAGRKTACPLCQEVIRIPGGVASAPALPDDLFAPPTRRLHATGPLTGVPRDLGTEAHLVALAVWLRIWCVLALIIAGLALVLVPVLGLRLSVAMEIAAVPLLLGVAHGALGHFLARYHDLARLLTAGLYALLIVQQFWLGPSLLSVVAIGFDVAAIVVLLGARSATVCTPAYRERVERGPDVSVPWTGSPFFWIPALLTLLALGLVVMSLLAVMALR